VVGLILGLLAGLGMLALCPWLIHTFPILF
jgi:hypothetical protein